MLSIPTKVQLELSVTSASKADAQETITAAHTTFQSGIWSRSSAIFRSTVISRLARLLERRIPDLAQIETLQTGRAIREMNAQLGRLPEWLCVNRLYCFTSDLFDYDIGQ
jgi:acyl-CoA reductase-like NAD-dependent aldehyde dehydrogenase